MVLDVEALAGFVDDELSVLPDELGALDDDPLSFEPADDDPSVVELFPESLDESLDESFDAASLDGLDSDFDDFSRLSVLKKPDPRNVTPTGVKTFLTGRSSPESGCATSVRVASVNACWTSIVSPVSTNL